jgi:hypothetical protein
MSELKSSETAMSNLMTFLNAVEILDITALSQDETTCFICQEAYSKNRSKPQPDISTLTLLKALPFLLPDIIDIDDDSPIRLPCGHIFGLSCMRLWREEGGTTCPLCRHEVCTSSGDCDEDEDEDEDEEYDRRLEEVSQTPLRELLTHHVPSDYVIRFCDTTYDLIRSDLPAFMVRVALSLYGVRALPEVVQNWSLEFDDATNYMLYMDEFWKRNHWYLTPRHKEVRDMLTRPEMEAAYVRICEVFAWLVKSAESGCGAVMRPSKLRHVLVEQCEDLEPFSRSGLVVGLGVRAILDMEGRKFELDEEFRRRYPVW